MTIEIPSDLAAAARRLADDRGIDLSELAVAGLEAEVQRRAAAAFPTTGGRGSAAGVTPSEAIALSYEQPSI